MVQFRDGEGQMQSSLGTHAGFEPYAAGRLWVREYDYHDEERPAPLWTVFDGQGQVLGFVETPKDLRIYEIGEDYILGRKEDELGVESVQMWPLDRSGG